jgi:hypothetical protein
MPGMYETPAIVLEAGVEISMNCPTDMYGGYPCSDMYISWDADT